MKKIMEYLRKSWNFSNFHTFSTEFSEKQGKIPGFGPKKRLFGRYLAEKQWISWKYSQLWDRPSQLQWIVCDILDPGPMSRSFAAEPKPKPNKTKPIYVKSACLARAWRHSTRLSTRLVPYFIVS